MTGQRSAAGKPVSIFVYALTVKRRRRQRVLIPVGDRKLNVQLCENGAMERCAAALAVCKGGWAGRYPRDEQNVGPGSRLRRHAAGKRGWERGLSDAAVPIHRDVAPIGGMGANPVCRTANASWAVRPARQPAVWFSFSRNSLGVMPTFFLKKVLKVAFELKPALSMMSSMVCWRLAGSDSSRLHSSIR